MCGIVGILDFDAPVEPPVVQRMAEMVAHRGPDGEGFWHGEHVMFGSRRLAIVDVPGGRQPTWNEDGTVHVVFNGEIYNHRALRQGLAARGHHFRSYSDVEVLPHLYEERELEFVEELDGDFAIALWDSRRDRLVLARDRVGVKPLFYQTEGRRLILASEVKGVLASGKCAIAVDRQGLSDCLFYGQPVGPGTFWAGVRDLAPGSVLLMDRQGISERRYYRPLERFDSDRPLLGGRAVVEAFRRTFTEAVRKRLPDEVKGAACLSGGIDSTAIAAVAARSCGSPLPTWSIRLPGEMLDEGTFSRRAARELGLDNHEIPITGEEASGLLPRTLWHLEAPQWFGVAPPFLELSRRVRDAGVKVMLTGDGADELLGGYDFYRLIQMNNRLTAWGLGRLQPPLLRRTLSWIGAPAGAVEHILRVNARRDEYRRRFGEMPAWAYLWGATAELAPPLWEEAALPPPSMLPAPPEHDALRRSLFFEYVTRLPSWILVLSDRLSMAYGVEVRVPFMDRYLLDLSAELVPDLLLHWGVEKYVLRRALRGVVPEQIRRRRKKPFFTPVGSWYLSGPGRELAGDYLSETAVRKVGIFDARATQVLRERALKAAGTWDGMLAEWACMMMLSVHLLVEQFTRANLVHPDAAGAHGPALHEARTARA